MQRRTHLSPTSQSALFTDRRSLWAWLVVVLLVVISVFPAHPSRANDSLPLPSAEEDPLPVQLLYVPDSHLSSIMRGDRYGGILTKAEFERLLTIARNQAAAQAASPSGELITRADYDLTISGDQLTGTLTVDFNSFQSTWTELRFDITGWSLEDARLNGEPATIARDGDGLNVLRVFTQTRGKQQLVCRVSTPLLAQGSDKAALFRAVRKGPGELRVTLPAGKYLELNGTRLERPAPAEAEATYLIPAGGRTDVRLRISDRQQTSRADLLTFASTAMGVNVLPGELTWTARTELQVAGQQIDRLTCRVPRTLEITSVESSGLESWELADAPDDPTQTEIQLLYRQNFDGRREIVFRGIQAIQPAEPWDVPTLTLPAATAHTGVVVVQHPEDVRLQVLEATGARPVSVEQSVRISPSVNNAASTGQTSYQLWSQNFRLRLVAVMKEQEVTVAMTNLLAIDVTGLELHTMTSVETRLAPLFDFRLRLPSDWEPATVQVEGRDVAWETLSEAAGIQEIRIPLNPPLLPGETRQLALLSRLLPDNWPVSQTPVQVSIPEVRLPQAGMIEALYGIAADTNFELVTLDLTGLDPVGQQQLDQLNTKLRSLGLPVRLGFTYQDTVFSGQLEISRKAAQLTAETISYFRMDRESQFNRLEAHLRLTGGGLRELTVLVSEAAGTDLRFDVSPAVIAEPFPVQGTQQQAMPSTRPLPRGRLIEQTVGEVTEGLRAFTLKFDRYLQGDFQLSTETRLPYGEAKSFTPLRMQFPLAPVVSGYLAVEAATDESLQVQGTDGQGRPLVAVDPVDFPPSRYRPEQRVVARYRFVQPDWQLSVERSELGKIAVPTVVGHAAHLTTVLGAAGELQHRLQLEFTAIGAQALLLQLPDNGALWSTLLNGEPVEIRQSAQGVQIPLSGGRLDSQQLEITYSTTDALQAPLALEGQLGTLRTTPPRLAVLDGYGERQSLEILKLDWKLHLQDELLVLTSSGDFTPVDRLHLQSLFQQLASAFEIPQQRGLLQRMAGLIVVALPLLLIALVRRSRWVCALSGRGRRVLGWGTLCAFCLACFVILINPIGCGSRSYMAGIGMSPGAANRFGRDDVVYTPYDVDGAMPQMTPGYADGMGGMGGGGMGGGLAEFDDSYGAEAGEASDPFAPPRRGLARELAKDAAQQDRAEQPAQRHSRINALPADGLMLRNATSEGLMVDQLREQQPQSEQRLQPRLSEELSRPAPPAGPDANGLADSRQIRLGMPLSQTTPAAPTSQAASEIAEQAAVSGLAAGARGRSSILTGGLLSIAADLQIPDGSRPQRFHYQGNGLESDELTLRLHFTHQSTGRLWMGAVALAVVILSWWLRNAALGLKGAWLVLTLLVPFSLAWVVPVLWQLLLEGVVWGGLIGLLLWLLTDCLNCTWQCCSRWFTPKTCDPPTAAPHTSASTGSSTAVTALLFASLSLGLTSAATLDAAERPAAPVEETQPEHVLVPYRSLKEIEAADRVWVPHALYRRLWQAAHPEGFPLPVGPVPATLAEAVSRGTLNTIGTGPEAKTQLTIQSRWVVAVLTDDPVSLPLPLQGAALESLTVDGTEARLLTDDQQRLAVQLQGRGLRILDARQILSVEGTLQAGDAPLQFLPTPAGLFMLDLTAEQTAARFRVNGVERLARRVADAGATRLEIPVDRGGLFTLSWFPPTTEGGDQRLVQFETAIQAEVDDTGWQLRHAFRVRVRHGTLQDLAFDLPPETNVRSLTGDDLSGWEVVEEAGERQLKVFLRREITEQTDLQIELFRPLQLEQGAVPFTLPTLAPRGASRETTQLALAAAPHLRMRVTAVNGLSQIDLSQYAPALAPQGATLPPQFAYRTAVRPFGLQGQIERRTAEAQTLVEHGVRIERRKQRIASRIVWTLSGAPVQRLDVQVPSGYLPLGVICAQASDWYVREEGGRRILTLEFPAPILGRIEAGLEGHVVKHPEDVTLPLLLPRPLGSSHVNSSLGIWVDDTYQGVIAENGGWRPIPIGQLSPEYRKLDRRPVQFAFRSDALEPEPVQLRLETAAPRMRADAITLIAVSDATIDYGLTLRWNITQAATDELLFTTPDWLTQLEITGPGIRQIRQTLLPDNRRRWQISLIDAVRDQYLLTAIATLPVPAEGLVQTPAVEFEMLLAGENMESLTSQQQFAILVNLAPGQLAAVDPQLAEPVAVDQLPLVVDSQLVQQAMEINRIRSGRLPSWRIQQLAEATAAQAVVLAAHLDTVLEYDGSWRTLARYAIRNRGRQFLPLEIPAGARILSVFVRDEPARAVAGAVNEQPITLIPLPQTSAADLSFDVEVLLAGRLPSPLNRTRALRGQQVSLPAPEIVSQSASEQFGFPVTQTLWTIHLPEDLVATPVSGVKQTNLTPHSGYAGLMIAQQTLERVQADIAEMSRLVVDQSVSFNSRRQAQENLKQLKQQLETDFQSYLAPELQDESSVNILNTLQSQNRDLARGVELQLADSFKRFESVNESPGFQLNGRAYIQNQNTFIAGNNIGTGINIVPSSADDPANTLTFNFVQGEVLSGERKAASGKAEKEVESRARLRSQLDSQSLVQSKVAEPGPAEQNSSELGRQLDAEAESRPRVQQRSMPQAATPARQGTWEGIGLGGELDEFSATLALTVPWAQAGGLSLPMDLPRHAQTLAFSKVGGHPVLTLAVKPVETSHFWRGVAWGLLCFCAGIWIVRRLIRSQRDGSLLTQLANLAIGLGLIGVLFLSGDAVLIAAGLFVIGGLMRACTLCPPKRSSPAPVN